MSIYRNLHNTVDNLQNQAKDKNIEIIDEISPDIIFKANKIKLHKSLRTCYQMLLTILWRIIELLCEFIVNNQKYI